MKYKINEFIEQAKIQYPECNVSYSIEEDSNLIIDIIHKSNIYADKDRIDIFREKVKSYISSEDHDRIYCKQDLVEFCVDFEDDFVTFEMGGIFEFNLIEDFDNNIDQLGKLRIAFLDILSNLNQSSS